jgi:AraC-like DNA-binding protein
MVRLRSSRDKATHRTACAVQQASQTFPHLEIRPQDDHSERTILSRRIGDVLLTRFRAPATTVETVGRRSVAGGLGHHLKMVWQLGGRMRYADAHASFDIGPGDFIITSMSGDHWMEMFDGHDALLLAFNPNDDPRWTTRARDALGTRMASRAGLSAAASGISALLSSPDADQTGALAARAMIDLALASTGADEATEPPLLARAGLSIMHNIADPDYCPARLARDLGLSRRSLYTRLASLGTTPAALIRRIRLDRVRQDIARADGRSLLDIALANGFPDGASLSRAFRDAYGQPPSALRRQA